MRPKYVTHVLHGVEVTHAPVPFGEAQVETEALCGTLFYPPNDGDEDPVFSQDGEVNCEKCKSVLWAVNAISSKTLLKILRTNHKMAR